MEFYIEHIYPWLGWAAVLSPVLPFVVGLWFFRKQKSPQFKLLFVFIAIGVLTELVSYITRMSGTKNNLWIAHFYTLLSFYVLSAIYYYVFDKVLWRRVVLAGVALLLLLTVYDIFVLDGIAKMNSLTRVTANSMIIVMAIAYFYKVANDAKVVYLDRDPTFLFSCAVLIYYAGTSMSYAVFNNALAISYNTARICLSIIMVLNIVFYFSQAYILKKMAV